MPGTRAADGERELTTGWQFATQIEDDDDDDERGVENEKGFELGAHVARESANRSALLIRDREMMFPSMLDPAFDEDYEDASPRPIAKEVELNSARSMEMDTKLIERHVALKAAHQT